MLSFSPFLLILEVFPFPPLSSDNLESDRSYLLNEGSFTGSLLYLKLILFGGIIGRLTSSSMDLSSSAF
jgi:hypothetical protein